MTYNIHVSENGKYIILKVNGNVTRESIIPPIVEAHLIGQDKGINKFLMDMQEARNTERMSENYDFVHVDMVQNPRIDQLSKIAALVSVGDNSHNFIETMCRNAGFDLTIFNDKEKAIDHLMRD